MTATYHIKIEQGATYLSPLMTWKTQSGNPIDLTGWKARMQVRQSISAPTVLLNLTTENGGIELGDALGTVRLKLSAEQTSALVWSEGVYDLELINPDSINGDFVKRFLSGKVNISKGVTR